MQVVKIGGSLYDTPELKKWLLHLTKVAKHKKIIIVPGGGPFADAVRHAQQHWHFDDANAHHMALLAMAQYGLLLHGLAPNSELLYYPESPEVKGDYGLSIWLPNEQLLTIKEIAQSWNATSDSLALWLTQTLSAEQLCLIKRVRPRTNSISKLTESSILDNEFGSLFKQNPVDCYIHYYQDFAGFGLSQQYAKRLAL